MQLQAPVLDSARAHVNQRLMNMTRAMVAAELARVRAGNGRPGFGERQGALTYADRDERGERRTRDVLAVEDYDAAFAALLDAHKHPGLGRFHALVQRTYAGIGRRKTARWYQNSATNQLHSRMRYRNTVRAVTSARPLGHLQIDLCNHSSKPSGVYKWICSPGTCGWSP